MTRREGKACPSGGIGRFTGRRGRLNRGGRARTSRYLLEGVSFLPDCAGDSSELTQFGHYPKGLDNTGTAALIQRRGTDSPRMCRFEKERSCH